VYIRSDCSYIPNDTPKDIDVISIQVFHNSSHINVTNFYQYEFIDHIKRIEYLFKLDNHIVCGDFNAHSPLWGHPSRSHRREGLLLEEFIDKYNYVSLSDGTPTFVGREGSERPVDLTFASNNLAYHIDWTVLDHPMSSDHLPIVITYQGPGHSSSQEDPPPPSSINRWRIPDDKLGDLAIIINTNIHNLEFDDDDYDHIENYDLLTTAIQQAAEAVSPSKGKTSKPPRTRRLPWWTKECSESVNVKRKAFKAYIRHKTTSHFLEYKRCKALTQAFLKRTKKDSWQKLCHTFNEKTNLATAWRILKSMDGRSKKRAPIHTLHQDNKIFTDNVDKANILGQAFAKVSSSQNYTQTFQNTKAAFEQTPYCPSNDSFYNFDDTELPFNNPLTLTEIKRALASTSSSNTSPGQDGITYTMLRMMDDMSLFKLQDVFNDVWVSGILPPSWNHSIVVPIPKPGKEPTSASSYRPISLTPCLCKLFEKIITSRLTWFLEHELKYDINQSGFRSGRSTNDNIARIYHDALLQVHDKGLTKAIFIDITKAFDMVWHDGLLFKLHNIGVNGKLFTFIQKFLTNRTFQVLIKDVLSDTYTLENGTPQGSVISPVLFIVMINDIPFTNSIQHSIYADDVAIWAGGSSEQVINDKIKENLLLLTNWCDEWGFQISPQKTQGIIFSKKRVFLPEKLYINDVPIQFTQSVKYLGVIFDTHLIFAQHINYIVQKCDKRINLLKCVTGTSWGTGKESLLLLYRSLIRSLMDYACFIYLNISKTQLLKLERIQYKALRVICGVPSTTPGPVLQAELGELPLKLRFKSLSTVYSLKTVYSDNNPTQRIIKQAPVPDPVYPCNTLHNIYQDYMTIHKVPTYGNTIPPKPPWTLPPIHIDTFVSEQITKEDPPDLIKKVALDNMYHYRDRTEIYTDGSKKDDIVSYSVYIPSFDIKEAARITNKISVFSSELFAIFSALFWVYQNNIKQSVIYTDSLSSLKSIGSLDHKTNHIVKNIITLLGHIFDKKYRVSLVWVPAHVGIDGNEVADSLAKMALQSPDVSTIPYSLPELKSVLTEDFLTQWQLLYNELEVGQIYRLMFPQVTSSIKFSHNNRHLETSLTQLRVGHNRLKFSQYKRTFSDSPNCTTCLEPETVEHFLFDCSRFNDARVDMYMKFKDSHIPYTLENCLGECSLAAEYTYKYICDTRRLLYTNWV
jgi:ribonuclease HI